jgi:hypothetical protein
MSSPEPPGDAPDTGDSLRANPRRNAPQRSGTGRLLDDLIAAMTSAGESAQSRYDDALVRLQERADDAVIEIARAEDGCHHRDYGRRWALIQAASELHRESALPYLRSVVMTPIPAEESADPHSFSTVVEETILRTTAIEGIGQLAAQGSESAFETLFATVELPSISIRRAAVQAVLATDAGYGYRDRLSALLPDEQQFLLDVKRVDVRDVPQVGDPRRHLAPGAGREEAPPAPLLPEDRDGDDDGQGHDAPTIRSR